MKGDQDLVDPERTSRRTKIFGVKRDTDRKEGGEEILKGEGGSAFQEGRELPNRGVKEKQKRFNSVPEKRKESYVERSRVSIGGREKKKVQPKRKNSLAGRC